MKIEEIKKLGLRTRFIDSKVVSRIQTFVEEGFQYIDLSGIEANLKEASINNLLKSFNRENLFISDTISSNFLHIEDIFNSNLDKLGYYDCFFISKVRNMSSYEEHIASKFLIEQKKNKKVNYVGIVYEGKPNLLNTLLSSYPDIDLVALDINYLDYLNNRESIRENINLCKNFNKKIIALNTYKNEVLLAISPEIEDIFRDYDPYSSLRSWAMKFVKSIPEVSLIISDFISKKELYDDIITIKYKNDEINADELKCFEKVLELM